MSISFNSFLTLLFVLFTSPLCWAADDDDDVPNRFISGTPSDSQRNGAWYRINQEGFSKSVLKDLELPESSEYKKQSSVFLLTVLAQTNTVIEGTSSIPKLVELIISQKEVKYPDLCNFNNEFQLLSKLRAYYFGAMRASIVASNRAFERYDTQSSIVSSFGGFRRTLYDDDVNGLANEFWQEGIRRGRIYGKKNSFLDEYYLHETFETVYARALNLVTELEKKLSKDCNNDSTPLMMQKTLGNASAENSSVFLVGVPKPNSKITIPFKSPQGTSVVIATYEKKSDSFVIKRNELIKIGLIDAPLKLEVNLNKTLDKDLYLIPPAGEQR